MADPAQIYWGTVDALVHCRHLHQPALRDRGPHSSHRWWLSTESISGHRVELKRSALPKATPPAWGQSMCPVTARCRIIKAWSPSLNSIQFWGPIPAPEPSMGSAEVFIMTASQLNSHPYPILPSFPHPQIWGTSLHSSINLLPANLHCRVCFPANLTYDKWKNRNKFCQNHSPTQERSL